MEYQQFSILHYLTFFSVFHIYCHDTNLQNLFYKRNIIYENNKYIEFIYTFFTF